MTGALGAVLGAVGWILLTIVVGVYIVAVLDHAIGAWVAREPVHVASVVARPVHVAALLLRQQATTTERPDRAVWWLAPALLVGIAAAALASVPLAEDAPALRSGIVFFGAVMAMDMVAVYLHGWAPNSLFPLIGGYRFVAEALSYEMPLALVLIAAGLPAESLDVGDIVRSQAGMWNVVRQPLGLPLYIVAALGLAFWGPLNFPAAADISGGTTAETSGVARLVWRVAQAAMVVAVAAMGAAAFLGGWLGPVLPGAVWMLLKTVALVVVLLAIGHRVGRVRLERFVVVAWAVLIPLALVDVFASGVLVLLGAA